MKIKMTESDFETVQQIKKPRHRRPMRPLFLLACLIRLISHKDLKETDFSFRNENMQKAGNEPCLILMNHSSFIDLEIAYKLFFPKPLSVVCTLDAFVGKSLLMRLLGCIPTKKFVPDLQLVSDMLFALKKRKSNVLLFPEAGYSFDGCATPLPERFGVLVKKLGVPVLTVKTEGAFLRDPLYNELQKRKTPVFAQLNCLFSAEEVHQLSSSEITEQVNRFFCFDGFAKQFENRIAVTESFRADGLERILYRCPACLSEDSMVGKGTELVCRHCGKRYEMDIYGRLSALNGETEFPHIPDWYGWEREAVRKEIENGTYLLDCPVEIAVLADYKSLYKIGSGRLIHNCDGFHLTDQSGKLDYRQNTGASYSLNADYFWYETGDVISIGDDDRLFYCFPEKGVNVAKARLATEELYKLRRRKKEKQV